MHPEESNGSGSEVTQIMIDISNSKTIFGKHRIG